MHIKKLKINNYRNLDGKEISFDDACNIIVGENNLGKSNLLNCLHIIFTNRAFRPADFADASNPIEILIQIKLADIEIGHFEDLFDLTDYHLINIKCTQLTIDDPIEFRHVETDTFIHPSVVRCVNFIHYDSLRNPSTEIAFDKGRGAGRFLSMIVANYLKEKQLSDIDYLNDEKVSELLRGINQKIAKLKSFNDFEISAAIEDDVQSLLTKVITLKDSKGDPLSMSGYGVQFLILISLSILERILTIKEQRKEKGIFEDESTHARFISLIIGLDEPEIHLHPYMQRSIIKYLNRIVSNDTPDFMTLVKELFDIDGFHGQIIVATHSPNILLNDYRQVIRLYASNGRTNIKSGTDVSLDAGLSKHLYMQFPFIKEAFFSRSVIFVEGASEEASFPHFASSMSVNLDDLGICVIQTRGGGAKTVAMLVKLAAHFDIQSVGIGDKDNNNPVNPPMYLTTKKDFDEEIVSHLLDNGKEGVLRSIVTEFDSADATVQTEALNKYAVKAYGVTSTNFSANLKLSEIQAIEVTKLRAFYLTWLSIKKSFPLGKLIGEKIGPAIPPIYNTVISKAVELAR